jgi:hypothetical protein
MSIPKFLLADNSQVDPDRIYVVHTETPKFIVGFDVEDFDLDQEIMWIDTKPAFQDEIDDLLADAEEFLNDELDNQEELFE